MDCNDEIKSMIAERMEKGKKEYGHGLIQNSGYDWVEEALDLSAKLIEIGYTYFVCYSKYCDG